MGGELVSEPLIKLIFLISQSVLILEGRNVALVRFTPCH